VSIAFLVVDDDAVATTIARAGRTTRYSQKPG
jgi:hypothetical protein